MGKPSWKPVNALCDKQSRLTPLHAIACGLISVDLILVKSISCIHWSVYLVSSSGKYHTVKNGRSAVNNPKPEDKILIIQTLPEDEAVRFGMSSFFITYHDPFQVTTRIPFVAEPWLIYL